MASVIFMGTPDFAAGIFESILSAGHRVEAVFTQPDRPKGRKGLPVMPPVKELALEHGIKVYQPQKIRSKENAEIIRAVHPDFIIVAAFGQIIPQEILDIPPCGCLNVHASLLPAWRGAAPIQWSILSGDRVTGVTIMRMDAGLDTGDMVLKREVEIRDDETGDSLFSRLMETGGEAVTGAMELILEGSAVYTPQPKDSPTPYAKMLRRSSGLIDWSRSAEEIERMVRAFYSWPGTFSYLDGRMIKIIRACAVQQDEGAEEAQLPEHTSKNSMAAGRIVEADGHDFTVQTGRGLLRLIEVQPEGKKRMASDAFLRGYHCKSGDMFMSEKV